MAKYSQSMLNEALGLSNQILDNNDVVDAKYGLLVNKQVEASITLPEDTVSARDFIAADNLYDSTTGEKLYDKGDTINSGTTFKGDWKVVVTTDEESLGDINLDDPEIVVPITDPEKIDEIDNGLPNTANGLSTDVDNPMSEKYSDATEWLFGYATDAAYGFSCDIDDDLACLGHLWNADRQNAIVLSSLDCIDTELKSPAIAQYQFIDKFGTSISDYRMTAIASNGNEFIGSFFVNYNETYMDINDRINLFINDINTGLEAVGIHLDGQSSTIKLVGSVDLKQHSSTSYDTLSVYDNLNTKRVEISPFDIPKRNASNSGIDVSKHSFRYASATKTVNKNYVKYNSWRDFWIFTPWQYSYTLENYSIDLTTSTDLGYITAGSIIDLSKLSLRLSCKAYLAGSALVSDRGTGQQAVTTLCYTLKKNGVAISGQNRVNLLSSQYNLSITGINTDLIGMAITGTFLDDYTVQADGNYSIEINAIVRTYAYYHTYTYYSNYYYKLDTNMTGDVSISISKPSVENNNVSNRKLNVGTNGLSFVGNNSRWFYTATDGYEMKWDDIQLQIDSTNGFRVNKLYEVINSGKTFSIKNDIYICNYSSNGYTCYLPNAREFGNGRILTVIGFQGLVLRTQNNDRVRVPFATAMQDYSVVEFGNDSISGSLVMPKFQVQLISANQGWYVVSYV